MHCRHERHSSKHPTQRRVAFHCQIVRTDVGHRRMCVHIYGIWNDPRRGLRQHHRGTTTSSDKGIGGGTSAWLFLFDVTGHKQCDRGLILFWQWRCHSSIRRNDYGDRRKHEDVGVQRQQKNQMIFSVPSIGEPS